MPEDPHAAPLTIDTSAAPDEYDVRSVEVLAVVHHVAGMLQAARKAIANGEPPGTLEQGQLETLTKAFRVGERVLEHQEVFLRDADSLDDDLLEDVRRWIVPVGEVLGADMTMDAAPGYSLEELRDRRWPSFGRAA